MHVLASKLVSRVGDGQPLGDLADAMQGVGISEHAGGRRDVGLEAVGQRIHARMRTELGGHAVGELGVHDGDVGRDLEVGYRVLDTPLIVGDDREGRDLGRGAGGRGNGAEVRLGAQLGEAEDLAHVLEGGLGVLVLDPHGLGRVDWATAADGDDPVGTKLGHEGGTSHDGLDGRVALNALEEPDLKACGLEVGLDLLQKAATTHRAAARDNDCPGTLEVLDLVAGTLSKIEVTWIGKTSHGSFSSLLSPPATTCSVPF